MATTPRRHKSAHTLPAGRFRQVHPGGDELGYWREVTDSLAPADRDELLAEWEAMDDATFAQATALSLVGVPHGSAASAAPAAPGGPQRGDLDVPDGPVEAVRAWVMEASGDDRRARAAAALDAELAKPDDRQRSTLVRPLRELLGRG